MRPLRLFLREPCRASRRCEHGSVVALPCGIDSSQFIFSTACVLVKRCLVFSRWATHLSVGVVSALATE